MNKLALLATVLLAACGNNKIQTPAQRGLTNKDKDEQKVVCPPAPDSSHTVGLTFARAVPAKVAVKLSPSATGFYASECGAPVQPTVQVSFSARSVSTPNSLAVNFAHNHAYTDQSGTTSLPTDQYLEVFDLHDCSTAEPTRIFKTETKLSLTWKYSFPKGASCAALVTGSAFATVTAEQESLAIDSCINIFAHSAKKFIGAW